MGLLGVDCFGKADAESKLACFDLENFTAVEVASLSPFAPQCKGFMGGFHHNRHGYLAPSNCLTLLRFSEDADSSGPKAAGGLGGTQLVRDVMRDMVLCVCVCEICSSVRGHRAPGGHIKVWSEVGRRVASGVCPTRARPRCSSFLTSIALRRDSSVS